MYSSLDDILMRLINDPEYRKKFIQNREEWLSASTLSNDECNALCQLDIEQLIAAAQVGARGAELGRLM